MFNSVLVECQFNLEFLSKRLESENTLTPAQLTHLTHTFNTATRKATLESKHVTHWNHKHQLIEIRELVSQILVAHPKMHASLSPVSYDRAKFVRQPIGIRNPGANCCFIAAFQFLVNHPVLRDQLLSKLDDKLKPLKKLILTYLTDRVQGRIVSRIESQDIRLTLAAAFPVLSTNLCDQEDVTEILMAVLTHLTDNPLMTPLNYRRTFSAADGRPDLTLNTQASEFTIPIDLTSQGSTQFEDLLASTLTTHNNGTTIVAEGVEYTCTEETIELPEDRDHYFFNLKRFTTEGLKLNRALSIPLRLPLQGNCYQLNSFIVHQGTATFGHYTHYFRRDDGTWFVANDSTVQPASLFQVKVALRGAYLLSYNKSTPLTPELTAAIAAEREAEHLPAPPLAHLNNMPPQEHLRVLDYYKDRYRVTRNPEDLPPELLAQIHLGIFLADGHTLPEAYGAAQLAADPTRADAYLA